MKLTSADRKTLLPLLDQQVSAIEALLLGGLTTSSEATQKKLSVVYQEASRLRLLRLGGALRIANEELGRYLRHDDAFSRKRLVFFLELAWLLGHGVKQALEQNDQEALEGLLRTPAREEVERLEVACLGVAKKIVPGAFCSFEFRLRLLDSSTTGLAPGTPLIWSALFPLKKNQEIPAEGYLHLPQRQKFKANLFLLGKRIVIEKAALARPPIGGAARVGLAPDATVEEGPAVSPAEWDSLANWDPQAALERLRGHEPGPLEIEVELQEEVVLRDWTLGPPVERERDRRLVLPFKTDGLAGEAVVSQGLEGKHLLKRLKALAKPKAQRPPLYGLIHYARCGVVLQPLSLLKEKGPEHLMISPEKIDRAALLRSLQF